MLDLPPDLRRVLPAARWEPVTVGESGAEVWRSTRFVVKVEPRHLGRVFAEKERLRWLAGRVPVPQVVGHEVTPARAYLAMTRLPGTDLSQPDARLYPERCADLMARALRELHALPLQDCPFNMSLAVRLREARALVAAGQVDEADFDAERQGRRASDLLAELVRTRPPTEDLVVTHGDACCPNFIGQGEHLSGLIDLGRAGIADRHMDLALAQRSITHNHGPQHAQRFLDTYGRAFVDPDKLAYYQLLDELF